MSQHLLQHQRLESNAYSNFIARSQVVNALTRGTSREKIVTGSIFSYTPFIGGKKKVILFDIGQWTSHQQEIMALLTSSYVILIQMAVLAVLTVYQIVNMPETYSDCPCEHLLNTPCRSSNDFIHHSRTNLSRSELPFVTNKPLNISFENSFGACLIIQGVSDPGSSMCPLKTPILHTNSDFFVLLLFGCDLWLHRRQSLTGGVACIPLSHAPSTTINCRNWSSLGNLTERYFGSVSQDGYDEDHRMDRGGYNASSFSLMAQKGQWERLWKAQRVVYCSTISILHKMYGSTKIGRNILDGYYRYGWIHPSQSKSKWHVSTESDRE